MTQLPDPAPTPPASDGETLGQYLRRVRIGNGIDLKKMSADTRLSLDTLTAVEKDDYKKIPGATYQKVFVKNIARYLELDPEKTYQRFSQETGLSPAPQHVTPAALPGQPAPSTEGRPTRGLVILLAILAGTLLLALLARKNLAPHPGGREETPGPAPSAAPDSLQPTPALPEVEAATEPLPSAPVKAPDSAAGGAAPPLRKNPFAREKLGALKVTVACVKESCIVFAFRNGQPWKNLFKNGNYKTFASDSTLYFKLEPPSRVTVSLNGVPLDTAGAAGGLFAVGRSGLEPLSVEAWKTITGEH